MIRMVDRDGDGQVSQCSVPACDDRVPNYVFGPYDQPPCERSLAQKMIDHRS